MSHNRKPREWQPMQRAQAKPWTAERQAAVRAMCDEKGIDFEDFRRDLITDIWMNDRYVAHVDNFVDHPGVPCHISYKRTDRKPVRDWRDAQRIKNDIAGEHTWAVEVYPDEDHIVDTANQYHLWCFPPGEVPPFGWKQGRQLGTPEEAAKIGAVQR